MLLVGWRQNGRVRFPQVAGHSGLIDKPALPLSVQGVTLGDLNVTAPDTPVTELAMKRMNKRSHAV